MATFSISEFLKEARRRRVFRVIGLYVVGVWALLQIADLAFESWGVSSAALRHVWTGALLGFPVALILGWRYDIDDGRVVRVAVSDASADLSIKRSDYVILTAVTFVMLAILYTIAIDVSETPAEDSMVVAVSAAAPNSIAVLPFVNMSDNPDTEYFSDGLSETLLHMLAQVPDLRVSARTSSFAFKNQNQDIRAIARSLGVAHILEGSVQRAGGRIRITAQLIRAEDGFHVWSENYDRTLEDVFGVQDEIAQLVSTSLTISLRGVNGGKIIEGVGTTNIAAYDKYLKALSMQAKSSHGALKEAEALLKEALAIDPEFLDAKTQLAINYFDQVETSLAPVVATKTEIEALMAQVLAFRPQDVRAKVLQMEARNGLAHYFGKPIDWDAVIDQLRAYIKEAPSEIAPKLSLAGIVATPEALQLMHEALALDPLNAEIHYQFGNYYGANLKDWGNARKSFERCLELEPEHPLALDSLSWVASNTGDAVSSVRYGIEAYELDPLDTGLPGARALFLYALGLPEQGDRFRKHVLAIAPTGLGARQLEIYRAMRFDSKEQQTEFARQMIADKLPPMTGVWPYFVLFNNAAHDGSVAEALAYMESFNPGFSDFGLTESPMLYQHVRLSALAALSRVESQEQIQRRIEQLDSIRTSKMVNSVGPRSRLRILAITGDLEGAVQAVLEEFSSKPAIAIIDFDLFLEQPFLVDVVADPRVQDALKRYQEEKSEAAREVAAYLAGLDSY